MEGTAAGLARRQKSTAFVACAVLAVTALVAGQPLGGIDEATAEPAKRLILSPKAGTQVPARPLLVEVRVGRGAKLFRAQLNDRPIASHFRPPRHGVRKLRVAPSHGLRFGRNLLHVRVRRASGKAHSQASLFRVRRDRPLAAAGRDRRVDVGARVHLDGSRSRSDLSSGATRNAHGGRTGLAHRWTVVDAPEGGRPGAALTRSQSPRPSFEAEAPGTYRIRLTVRAVDGDTGSDEIELDALPDSVATHIDEVAGALRVRNPDTEGKIWGISEGNELPADWLLQTPRCWGQPNCGPGPLPPSAAPMLSRMTQMVSRAERSVELTGLWPPADGGFRDAIVDGLRNAIAAGHTPTLRVILGTPPFQFDDKAFQAWFDALVADVGGEVPIEAAAVSTYRQSIPPAATSWNHSKLLAVDGRSAIVGGMNYWSKDYLQVTDPVDDVSMTLDGPAARDAVEFADVLWGWICENRDRSVYVSLKTSNVKGCLSEARTLRAPGAGDVPILTVGRLGNGIDVPGEARGKSPPIPAPPVKGSACNSFQRQVSDTNTNREYEYRNPGETALRALIASAKRSVFLSQQDLLSCVYSVEALFDDRVFAALGTKIAQGVPITIVISDEGATSAGDSYTNGYSIKDVAQTLTKVVTAQNPSANAREMVCDGVGLAGMRTLDSTTWPNTSHFANHAKLVSVDDSAFYVGSENLYPARLQELGLIVESAAAAATLKADYLDPLWSSSRAGALIDPSRGVCDF